MAKTLVALYDTCTDAERVVHELHARTAFPGAMCIWLWTTPRVARPSTQPSRGTPPMREAPWVIRSSTSVCLRRRRTPMRRESAEAGHSWWSRVAMSRLTGAWRSCNGCTRSISTSGAAQWRQEGWTGADATARPSAPRSRAATATRSAQEQGRATARVAPQGASPQRGEGEEEVTIPVVDEEISIGTQEVERGHVRIDSRVTEQPVEEAVRLREEKVTVERRPVDRPATEADFAAAAKEVIEMTETAEEPVVTKRARVVEEVVVHKEVTEHTETVRGTVRRTDVDVQREPGTATEHRRGTAPQDFATYDPLFRQHYTTALAAGARPIRSMSLRTAMATSWPPTSATGGATGPHWKPTPAATGKRATPAPGSASKTPSAMAGTASLGIGPARSNVARPMDREEFTTYSDDFRQHYVTAFGDRGAAYTEYEPAYRYGYELGTNERYRGRDVGRFRSRRPPGVGSAASEYVGPLQRRHPLWLGHSPRADLNRATHHWYTGSTRKCVIAVDRGYRVYESRVEGLRTSHTRE